VRLALPIPGAFPFTLVAERRESVFPGDWLWLSIEPGVQRIAGTLCASVFPVEFSHAVVSRGGGVGKH